MQIDNDSLRQLNDTLLQLKKTVALFPKNDFDVHHIDFSHRRAHDLAVESLQFFVYTNKNTFEEINTKEHVYQAYKKLYQYFLEVIQADEE